jgi:MFS family permease
MIGIAQLMAVLDATVINIALPSAPRALGLHHVRPAMGGHRLRPGVRQPAAARRPTRRPDRPQSNVPGRAGGVSAIGGASVSFAMLITAQACRGAFAALLIPSALSLLTTTFTEPKHRAKAFGICADPAEAEQSEPHQSIPPTTF